MHHIWGCITPTRRPALSHTRLLLPSPLPPSAQCTRCTRSDTWAVRWEANAEWPGAVVAAPCSSSGAAELVRHGAM